MTWSGGVIELLGTSSFAISGALAARTKRLDVFGVLVICFATAVGGGTIRDLMLGRTPVGWLQDLNTISVIFGSYLVVLLFRRHLHRIRRLLLTFDAIGLGFATVAGVGHGLDAQLSPAICVALGTVSGCFGGVLRDVLLNEIPLVFRTDFYASAAIVGGFLYFVFLKCGLEPSIAGLLAMSVIVGLRLVAVRYKWRLPGLKEPEDG